MKYTVMNRIRTNKENYQRLHENNRISYSKGIQLKERGCERDGHKLDKLAVTKTFSLKVPRETFVDRE